MFKLKRIACLLASAFAGLNVYGQNVPLDSIPFYMAADSRIYTACRVNNSDVLNFLVDTGASDMVLNSRTRPRLDIEFPSRVENQGTTGKGDVGYSPANVFYWGHQTIGGVPFIELPYAEKELDGVIGLNVLKRFVVEIDYTRMQIYLYDKNRYTPPVGGNGLAMVFRHGVPFVDISLPCGGGTVSASVEVDTGSDRILDLSNRFVNESGLIAGLKNVFAVSTISSSDGRSAQIYNVFLDPVLFAGYRLYRVPGGYAAGAAGGFGVLSQPDVDGMLGNNFLKRFNQVYDFGNNVLYLKLNDNLYTPFYPFLVSETGR